MLRRRQSYLEYIDQAKLVSASYFLVVCGCFSATAIH